MLVRLSPLRVAFTNQLNTKRNDHCEHLRDRTRPTLSPSGTELATTSSTTQGRPTRSVHLTSLDRTSPPRAQTHLFRQGAVSGLRAL